MGRRRGIRWTFAISGVLAACAPVRLSRTAEAQVAGAHHARYPAFRTLAAGPQKIPLLPGQQGFTFTMYGAPGEPGPLEQLIEVMRRNGLGNGFDPIGNLAPKSRPIFDILAAAHYPAMCYSGAEMQIVGGRSKFGQPEAEALAPMDRAGVFAAVQLGEWGYYFHNLAPSEPWWHDVYGKDFEQFKHLMKPPGLAGYTHRPSGKRECYDIVKDYFMSRKHDLLDRVISVTGHSHYEAYVGEWGAKCVGLEVGENIAFTQSKLAFARGASRAWRAPWSVQVSPWFATAVTCNGPLRMEGGVWRGLDAGHSLSFYERMWLHGWFAGAAMVTPENSSASFFEKSEAPWTLTSHGRKAMEVFHFMRSHDRGIPYTPVAIVLDHLAGYNGYMDRPWGILTPTTGDRELRDLFDSQLFPGSDHIHKRAPADNPEITYLRPTPFGEAFDVLLTSAPAEVLRSYPVILLAGDVEFDPAFVRSLERSLRAGCRLLMSGEHRKLLGARFGRLARLGAVEVLSPWTNPLTGRPAAISNDRLRKLAAETLPIDVSGDPIEYQINRTRRGWVIELINNSGVVKRPGTPAVTDPAVIAHVHLKLRVPWTQARAWRAAKTRVSGEVIDVEVGPGRTEYVEFW
jgi:hypothetical protein